MALPFWLNVLGQKFMFQSIAEDADGNKHSFALPLMFVPYEAVGKHADIRNAFIAGGLDARTLQFQQQVVAFAPSGDKPGSTHLKTESLTYDIEQPPGTAGSSKFLIVENLPPRQVVRYLPWITNGKASSPALEEITGSTHALALRLDQTHYLEHGFDAAQSFIQLDNPISLSMGAQKGGGLARPDSTIQVISRTLGPAGAPDALAAGKVDISPFIDARILGTIPIQKILADNLEFDPQLAAEIPTADQLENTTFKLNAPRLTTTRILDGSGQVTAVETRYLWKPLLKDFELPPGVLTLGLAGADLLLDARLTRQSASGKGSLVVVGRLRNALLSFKDAVAVKMGELIFRAEEGRKMEVGAKEVDLTFLGPLQFVNSLRQVLPDRRLQRSAFRQCGCTRYFRRLYAGHS